MALPLPSAKLSSVLLLCWAAVLMTRLLLRVVAEELSSEDRPSSTAISGWDMRMLRGMVSSMDLLCLLSSFRLLVIGTNTHQYAITTIASATRNSAAPYALHWIGLNSKP